MIFLTQASHIDVSGIKQSNLTNAGLLIATLVSQGEEVIDIKLVVQVTKNGDDFVRIIFNPLD